MSVFFCSDLHFGHEKLAELRGFDSVDEHDDAILDVLYTLPLGSHLWILGDISSGKSVEQENALRKLDHLAADRNLVEHLIFGNHESPHPMHRSAYREQEPFKDQFDSIQSFAVRRMEGRRVLLAHHPYNGDSGGRLQDRHVEYRMRDTGMPIIHGHTHWNDEKVTLSDAGSIQIHVGWDAWHRPVAIDEVSALLRKALDPETASEVISIRPDVRQRAELEGVA